MRYYGISETKELDWHTGTISQLIVEGYLEGSMKPPAGVVIPEKEPPKEHMETEPEAPTFKRLTLTKVTYTDFFWEVRFWISKNKEIKFDSCSTYLNLISTSQLSKAVPSTESTLTVPDSLMKAWFNDPKHGQEFRAVVDRLAEEFKVEEATKVKKRVFKGGGTVPKSKATKTVDMSGFNVKPASEEPQNVALSEVNMLNLPDCKLVIQANTIYIKNCGENKVVIVQTSISSNKFKCGSCSYFIHFDWLTTDWWFPKMDWKPDFWGYCAQNGFSTGVS